MVLETAVTGCARKCACRLWVNCPYYKDLKKQILHLREKEYNFKEWYNDNFREDIKMADTTASI